MKRILERSVRLMWRNNNMKKEEVKHLSRIHLNASLKEHPCWYIRWSSLSKLGAFQKLKKKKKSEITCNKKGNDRWSYNRLLFSMHMGKVNRTTISFGKCSQLL